MTQIHINEISNGFVIGTLDTEMIAKIQKQGGQVNPQSPPMKMIYASDCEDVCNKLKPLFPVSQIISERE